jgi:hypothetical protein
MAKYPAGEPDVIDLGSRHFMRAHHELIRTREPEGTPVLAGPDTPVIALMFWHDCTESSSWQMVFPADSDVVECPICGDRGRIRNGRWVKVKA